MPLSDNVEAHGVAQRELGCQSGTGSSSCEAAGTLAPHLTTWLPSGQGAPHLFLDALHHLLWVGWLFKYSVDCCSFRVTLLSSRWHTGLPASLCGWRWGVNVHLLLQMGRGGTS